ncbi:ATP-binding cassette, subfamily F, member 3 [Seinonella peptonophila]|uniref:ATP-binding cassette, subfamily F, member 3 n=1 Tax=Seinonella peptonophila TaxID=112248 RepID=A0A1M4Y3Z4_9BACL|nr:ABC-F family ATP-binding cassette domain-containing protein [Seinonella peptonophila]SHF00303.1 ATP-binding cassette, subfamily F, member 3 [Seinonella peptonophila]
MLLQANQLAKSFGGHEVFTSLDLKIDRRDRIGLIGVNGAGKSTLLQILTGELSADHGQIHHSRHVKISYLKQSIETSSGKTIWEEAKQAFTHLLTIEQDLRKLEQQMSHQADEKLLNRYANLETHFGKEGGYQYETAISSALQGLGLGSLDWHEQKVSELSGGQKTRLALARQLLEKPDLLILDEPTNYLDLNALTWLEQMLINYEKAFLVVSHDRYFLDRLVEQIWELEDGQLQQYTGNYTKYVELKEAARAEQEKNWKKQEQERKHHEDFVARNIVRATTSKRAQSRRKLLEKMERIDRPKQNQQKAAIRFEIERPSGQLVLTAKQLCCGYEEPLTSPLSFEIRRGERIALLGPNGVGKSTLLHTLAGKQEPLSGYFQLGHQVSLDLYDQEQRDLSSENRVLDEIWNSFPQYDQAAIRSFLGQFLFSQDEVFQKVSSLSGGEKARLSLLKRLLGRSNFLLLDEPSNHLDLISKERLETALDAYPGTLLFVSHDRYLIKRIANQIWELSPKGLTIFKGDYESYLEQKSQHKKQQQRTKEVQQKTDHHKQKKSHQQQQRQVAQLEEAIAQLERQIANVEQILCQPEVFENHQKLHLYEQELLDYQKQLEKKTEQWLKLVDDDV